MRIPFLVLLCGLGGDRHNAVVHSARHNAVPLQLPELPDDPYKCDQIGNEADERQEDVQPSPEKHPAPFTHMHDEATQLR